MTRPFAAAAVLCPGRVFRVSLISKDVTKEQAAQMDVMRSKTDIISAVMAPKLGPDPCKVKMEKAIKQLDTVPTDEVPGLQPAQPAAPSSGTN